MDVSLGAAEILVEDELYELALGYFQLLFVRRARRYGRDSVGALKIESRIASVHMHLEQYAEALKTFLDIYRRQAKVLGLKNPRTLDTRSTIIDLLERHGTTDVTSEAMKEIGKVFRDLIKITKKKYRKGLYEECSSEGIDILEDMQAVYVEDNFITGEMGSLIAFGHAAMENYDYALELLEELYLKKIELFGPGNRRTIDSLMRKASVLRKTCDLEQAMRSFIEVHDSRKIHLGNFHRKTLVSKRCIAETMCDLGNYDDARALLAKVAHYQEKHKYKEAVLTRVSTGLLEFARGKYQKALVIFRKASKTKTHKRLRALIHNKIGALLIALGMNQKARPYLMKASRILQSTSYHADRLSTFTNIAVALAKEGEFTTAEAMLNFLIEACERVLSPGHSIALSVENELGEIYFSREQFDEALKIFEKVRDIQRLTLGPHHPAFLNAKCQVARVFRKQRKYDEALRIYNEIVPMLNAYFYPQHRDRLKVYIEMAALYLYRGSYAESFETYYKIYEIMVRCYGANHPYTFEIIDIMQTFTDTVSMRRIIEAAWMEKMDDLESFVRDGDDVNARDINGAVALHYASRDGCINALKYLLYKGAIYDIKDMIGNTPESFATDGATMLVFLLVKRLFKCVKLNDRENARRIIQRENLIINVRDAGRRTPLMWAVAKGHVTLVSELISRGADVMLSGEEDGTVLHMAAERGNNAILRIILWQVQRDDIHVFRRLIDNQDNVMGTTALHIAAKNNDWASVDVLIKYRANPLLKEVFDKFPYDMGDLNMNEHILTYAFHYLRESSI